MILDQVLQIDDFSKTIDALGFYMLTVVLGKNASEVQNQRLQMYLLTVILGKNESEVQNQRLQMYLLTVVLSKNPSNRNKRQLSLIAFFLKNQKKWQFCNINLA